MIDSQQTMQNALFQAEQLGIQAAQVREQAARAQAQANQQRVTYLANAQAATERQKTYVQNQYKAEQFKQDAIAEQYNILLQNITNLEKSMVADQATFTNIMYSNSGALKASAAGRGIVAGTLGNQEEINFMVQEVSKTASNEARRSQNEINDVANKALALQIEKAFSKWNLDTQINFSNMMIRDEVY